MSTTLKRRLAAGAIPALTVSTGVPAIGQGPADQAQTRQAAPNARSNNIYVVRLSGEPVVAYRGGVPGLAATRPNRGQKVDPNNPQVARYAAYLDARHDAALAAGGGGRKIYDYRYSFNGFAAELSEAQAAAIAALPNVLAVSRDELLHVDTSSTPAFLGLNAPGGLWSQLGGVDKAGEDIIIGVVDAAPGPKASASRTAPA